MTQPAKKNGVRKANGTSKNRAKKKNGSATDSAKEKWGTAEVHNGDGEHREDAHKPQLYSVNGAAYYKPSPDQREYTPYEHAQGRAMRFRHGEKPSGYSTQRLKEDTAKALALAFQSKLRGNKPTIENFYAYKRSLTDSQRAYLRSVLTKKGYKECQLPDGDNDLVNRVRSVINSDIHRHQGPYMHDIVDHMQPSHEDNVVVRALLWVRDFAVLEYYNFTWNNNKTAEFNRKTLDRNPEDVVVVGHGLWQNAGGMYLAARYLREQGFDVLLLEYSGNTRWPWKIFGPKFLQSQKVNESTAHEAVASLDSLIQRMPNVKGIHSLMHSDGENILASLYTGSSPYIRRMMEHCIHVITGGDQKGDTTGLKPLHCIGVVGGKDHLVATDVINPRANDYFVVLNDVGHLYEVTGRHGSFPVYAALLGTTHIHEDPADTISVKGSSGIVLRELRMYGSPDYTRAPHTDTSLIATNPHTGRLDVRKAV